MAHQTVLELLPVQFSLSAVQSQKNEKRSATSKPPSQKVIKVTPVIIHFHRLFFNSKLSEDIIPGDKIFFKHKISINANQTSAIL